MNLLWLLALVCLSFSVAGDRHPNGTLLDDRIERTKKMLDMLHTAFYKI